MSCFYATFEKPIYPPGEEKEENPACGMGYYTRSVDLENIFPDRSGEGTSTEVNSTNTGRTPGFNWSSYATIPYSKDEYMAINPTSLIGEIQSRKESIYEQANEKKYLDYEFYLTPSDLIEIKNQTKSSKYSDEVKPISTGDGVDKGKENYGYSDANLELCGHSVYTSALINYLDSRGAVKKRITQEGTTRCCNNVDGLTNKCEYIGVDKNT